MITDNNKKLAQWAMDYTPENGRRAAKLVLYSNSNAPFELRDAKMGELQQTSGGRLSTGLYADGKYGSYSVNRLDKKELETFIKNGTESTRYLAVDRAHMLPDASRRYRGGKPDLQLSGKQFDVINPDDKVAVARVAAEEVLDRDNRIIPVGISYSDGENVFYRLASNGFEGEPGSIWFSMSTDVTMRGEGEMYPLSYWYESVLFYGKLMKSGIGVRALERVLQKLGQRKVTSNEYTIVVDPMNSSNLLSPVLSTLYGFVLQQKDSFLLDRLNTKVGAELLNLMDEPHLIGARGARYFDSEGVATEPRSVFESGALRTYSIDTYSSKKMGVELTVNSPSLSVFKPRSRDLNGSVTDVQKGILVTDPSGGNCNSSSGDFSYGIEGFLVEDDKLTQLISEMNVTDSMITLQTSSVAVGNDACMSSSWCIPSLASEGVDFSGL